MDGLTEKNVLKIIKPQLNLKICLKILRATGSWPPEKSGIYRYLFVAYSLCCNSLTLGILFAGEIINVIFNYNDLSKIASGAPIFFTNLLYMYKYVTVIRHHRRLRNLLAIVDSPIFSENNLRYKNIVSWYASQGIFHHVAFQIVSIISIVFWNYIPLNAILNGEEKKLPLDGWYPFDLTNPITFNIAWLQQVVAILLCATNNIAIDILICSLVNVASCQFELLKWNLATIGNISETQSSLENSKEYINQKLQNISMKLRRCIQHNLVIFDFFEETQRMFRTVVGCQMIFNSIIICLLTFAISQMSTSQFMIILGQILYIISMSYQIFLYCWFGNELHLQNENLSTAIYMGNWWKLNVRYKKDLQIIMLRNQKPLIFYTNFYIKLTVQTFLSVMQTSYSMYALLHKSNRID